MAILPGSPPVGPFSATAPARLLPPQTRQQLALDALGGQSVTELAAEQQVSRKFVYQQLRQAHDALDHAFNPGGDEPDQLLFWLPVTKPLAAATRPGSHPHRPQFPARSHRTARVCL